MLVSRDLHKTVETLECETALHDSAYFGGALEVFHAIPIDVVMRSDGFLELVADNHTRALSGWPAGKQHNTPAGIWECRLQYC
jgi:hypothetical protein